MPNRVFVLDTSLFVNPHSRGHFGKTPTAAVKAFLKMISKMRIELYIPPSVFNEMKNFIEKKTIDELELSVKKKAPNMYAIYLPAAVLYDFIDDIRTRINKGMRLAEEFTRDSHPDVDMKLGKLREKYREAMRSGIIDSKEDVELVLLTKELDATLISSDEGVLKFAEQIGCTYLNAEKFHALLKKIKKMK